MVRFYKYKHEHPYGEQLQSIWALINDDCKHIEPLISDGFPEILFLISGLLKIHIGSEKYDIKSHAYIGLFDKKTHIELAPNTIILSFKLMPWMTSNIIKDEAHYIKNQVISLSDLNPNNTFNDLLNLDKINSIDTLIHSVLSKELPKIFNKKATIPSALLFDVFSQFNSLQTLSESSRLTGSSRYFEKLYRKHVGVSPMRYKRLLKIKKSTLILAENEDVKIEPLALALGYYDLSHFYKDFSIFTNETPNAFKMNCHRSILLEDTDYVNQYLYS